MTPDNSTWRWTNAFASLSLLSQYLWFGSGGIHTDPGNFALRSYYFVYFVLLPLLLAVQLPRLVAAPDWCASRALSCVVPVLLSEPLLVGLAAGLIPQPLSLNILSLILMVLFSSAIGSLTASRGTGQQAW